MNLVVARIHFAAACSTAKLTSNVAFVPELKFQPAVIYVGHIDSPDDAIKLERPAACRPLYAWRERSQANSLAEDMKQDVVQDLIKKRPTAERLAPGEALPTCG